MILAALLVAATTAAATPPPRPPDATYTYTVTAAGTTLGSSAITMTTGSDGTLTLKEAASYSAPIPLTATVVTRYAAATLTETGYSADFALPNGPQHVEVSEKPGGVHVTIPGQAVDIAADPSAPFELVDDRLLSLHAMVPALVHANGLTSFTLAVLAGGRAIVATVASAAPPAAPANVPAGDATLAVDAAGLRLNYWYDPATFVVHAVTIPAQGVAFRLTATTTVGFASPSPQPHPTALPTAFPHFTSREVRFRSADGTLLAGTLTVPDRGHAPFASVVFVHGSGPEDRDETIGPNPVFLQLSNALSNAGFTVLRYDKRGVAKSGGANTPGTRDELLADVTAAFRFVRTQPEVDRKRVFLLGHSEGGELVPSVAVRQPAVAGIVLLAPPALPLWQISMKQALESTPAEKQAATRREELAALDRLRHGSAARDAWYRSSMDVDPVTDIARVHVPILILQGTADVQILPADLPRLVRAARAKNRSVTVRLLSDDNHLFEPVLHAPQTPQTAVFQYLTVPERVDPRAVAAVVTWLAAR